MDTHNAQHEIGQIMHRAYRAGDDRAARWWARKLTASVEKHGATHMIDSAWLLAQHITHASKA